MQTAVLIFPHQLFEDHPAVEARAARIVMAEEPLFFGGDEGYPLQFHRRKLILLRSAMTRMKQRLEKLGLTVEYREYVAGKADVASICSDLAKSGFQRIRLCATHDFALDGRIRKQSRLNGLAVETLDSPMFLNSAKENRSFKAGRRNWRMIDFYKWQRRRLDLLIDAEGNPLGDQWSFDEANRRKLPKKEIPRLPKLAFPASDEISEEARRYAERHFPDAWGETGEFLYPSDSQRARQWLEDFLDVRLEKFGPYEDAIIKDRIWLYHSVLTPMLNIGLLTPREVIDALMKRHARKELPLNSLEGFLRQVIGWREFMRATYDDLGVAMRTSNHWGHRRPIPKAFFEGNTGLAPFDDTVKKILKTGYCHHIERLMIAGGLFFLGEFHPDAVYSWYMSLFVDAYDWVMVPNTYGMSQNADGGSITTKPYFSGSNYILKMSNYSPGEWCKIWDGLYWSWILKNSRRLEKNPRWSMMVKVAGKMGDAIRRRHLDHAEAWRRALGV